MWIEDAEAPLERLLLRLRARRLRIGLVAWALLGLAVGCAAWAFDRDDIATFVWTTASLPVLAALLAEILASLTRGEVGLDIIAALSMSVALVMGESLAAAVVALMYAGGQLLETFAEGRARREMTALLGRVARTALRHHNGELVETPVGELAAGDRVLIRHGEVVPVDGRVVSGEAVLDLSALTGESAPARRGHGGEVLSGVASVGPAFDLIVTRRAAESTYAGIVRLVEDAQRSKAPMVRLADRYAIWFLAVTVVIAGVAWLLSGDPRRALAVLVVATPCPLILAVPVAIVSGMSRVARLGVLVKNGGGLEALARVRTAVLDKTGTLTEGRPRLVEVRCAEGLSADDVLRLAASLDQASSHVFAAAIIEGARERGLSLSLPENVEESAGSGLTGKVDGRVVIVGGSGFVQSLVSDRLEGLRDGLAPGAVVAAVGIDGRAAGLLVLADSLRPNAAGVLAELRGAGVTRIILATGDRAEVAQAVSSGLPFDLVLAELTPDLKVAAVRAERGAGIVMMVGDGVNDAPALAAADVGVAMAARGAIASSEAADIVLLVDRLEPLLTAMRVARRTRAIALQSVALGLGLSLAGMLAAAAGFLPPVQGALAQEAIDVAVILNALRALRQPSTKGDPVRATAVQPT